MTERISLPGTLTGGSNQGSAVLTRSGEGITFSGNSPPIRNTASVPFSPAAARTVTTSPNFTSQVSQTDETSSGKSYVFNTGTIIWLIIIPIIVWMILYSLKPHFVTDLSGDKERTINTSKLLLWTIVISIILLVLIYVGYTMYTGNTIM